MNWIFLSLCLATIKIIDANPALDHGLQEIPTHCPPEGVFGYPHPKACDEYFQCTNGTMTHELCPNGLLFSHTGHVFGFCAYHWNVDCQGKTIPKPISTPGCPWQFGFFAEDDHNQCNVFYSECSWGQPQRKQCEPYGLFYDERIKGCNWPDQVGCSSESLLQFKCPEDDHSNKYWPYPRYWYNQQAIITCVSGQPRLIKCGENSIVEAESLTCQEIPKVKEPSLLHGRHFQ
ncbi:Chondroitin sulfate synthase 2 [Sarcoptes scabiei]|nr:Chondroitin sulfate synthase 2 [Sarcoptes scabiei]